MTTPGQRLAQDNERGARTDLIEQLFYDFHRTRRKVYWLNFWRGLYFGVGSVIGGTLIVALVVWLLSWLVDIPGGLGDFVQYIVDTVRQKQ